MDWHNGPHMGHTHADEPQKGKGEFGWGVPALHKGDARETDPRAVLPSWRVRGWDWLGMVTVMAAAQSHHLGP